MARELITAETRRKAIDALQERHAPELSDERFDVQARLEGDTVVATVTLAKRDRTFVYDMEAAVTLEDTRLRNVQEGLETCLDFLDWYLGEFFRERRELLLPLDWRPHRFGDLDVLARGDYRNEVLDDLADRWLRGERPEIPAELAKKSR